MLNNKYLYINSTPNCLKFHGLESLKNGDSVLVASKDKDNWVDFFYSKPKKIGKWQINKLDAGTGPSIIFKTW